MFEKLFRKKQRRREDTFPTSEFTLVLTFATQESRQAFRQSINHKRPRGMIASFAEAARRR